MQKNNTDRYATTEIFRGERRAKYEEKCSYVIYPPLFSFPGAQHDTGNAGFGDVDMGQHDAV